MSLGRFWVKEFRHSAKKNKQFYSQKVVYLNASIVPRASGTATKEDEKTRYSLPTQGGACGSTTISDEEGRETRYEQPTQVLRK